MRDGDCEEESDSEIVPVEEDVDEEEPPIHEWANCSWLFQLFEEHRPCKTSHDEAIIHNGGKR